MPDIKEPVKKTASELINSKLEDLNKDEIELRITYIRAMAEEAKLEDTKNNLDDRRNKMNMRREKLIANGRELTKTARDQKMVQDTCVHRKGGRGGVPGGLLKGTDVNHSLLKHLLPTNELWIRCTRCGKTFKPAFRENYPEGTEGDTQFNTARDQYKWAVEANTDNQTSTSITFQWTSEDDNKSAKKFIRETMKDVTLR